MNGSVVIAKIAGMLSTAKITSVIAISISTANSGVNQRLPSWVTLSALPWYCGVRRRCLRMKRSTGLASRSGSLPAENHILMPVSSRNAPNTYSSQWNLVSSTEPAKIITARSTIAPSTPITSTRWRCSSGTAK
ncbi:hypothetical protein NB689_002902 [Xanthomonas sacchari]|nr:hypothetical protein [Xanthomonas sacchari]